MAQILTESYAAEESKLLQWAEEFPAPEGSYEYIPVDVTRFLRLFYEVNLHLERDKSLKMRGVRYRPLKVLEIGCGAGRNLRLLRDGRLVVWAELTGIDINAPMIEAGQSLCGPDIQLLLADAMSFDYSDYDLIFTYRPFSADAMEHRFEERVRKMMRPGAYLVAALWMGRDRSDRMEQLDSSGEIFRTRA